MSKDRIRFLSEQIFETGGPGKGPKFPEGFVLAASDVGKVLGASVSAEYADGFLGRWVNRGVAEYVRGDAKVSPVADVGVDPGTPPVVVSKPFGTARHGAPVRGIEIPGATKKDGNLEPAATVQASKGKSAAEVNSKGKV
jgi:hypothetical protein